MAKALSFKFKITEKDLGIGRIKNEVSKLAKKPYVKVGVQGQSALEKKEGSTDNANVVMVATVHEFGAPSQGVPERSYIRKTINENEAKYRNFAAQLKDKILSEGMSTEQALNLLGEAAQADIQNTIRNDNAGLSGPTPLKYRDGVPLYDTGQHIRSIRYVREMNGGSK